MGKKNEKFNDYKAFVEKFEPKRTTDDCYTPPAVYDAVLKYVLETYPVPEGARIMRPFRPGGDYQAENYSAPCCVVDNPPFSIMAQILDFYQSRQIPFFLFAPQMTIFCTVLRRTGVTFVSANIDIIYTNGARVKTAFVTNMSPELVFTTSPQLHNAISIANISSAKKTPKIELSPNIFSAKYIQKISTGENINFQLKEPNSPTQ